MQRLAGAIEHLFPGYFALVMATGIVSIAAHVAGSVFEQTGLQGLAVAGSEEDLPGIRTWPTVATH